MRKTLLILLILLGSLTILLADNGKISGDENFQNHLQFLENWISSRMEYHKIPGLAFSVVAGDEMIYSNGLGYANMENGVSCTAQTIFRIASITKTFTSTAILMLWEEQKLSLDDPIKEYIPWFEIQNPFEEDNTITIRQLLTHSSGLPREAAFPYWSDHKFPTMEQIRESLPQQQMIRPPAMKFAYSNLGMALLGEVVAAASGETYEEFIESRILKPLKMESTSVFPSKKEISRMATPYERLMPSGNRKVSDFTESKGIAAAANMSSTVEDMARYIAFHLSGKDAQGHRLLTPRTLRQMHRVQWLHENWTSGWGLGFSISKDEERNFVGHGGWVAGNRTQILFCPEEDFGVMVMINSDDTTPYLYAEKIYKTLQPVVSELTAKPKEQPVFQEEWDNYLGLYRDPWQWEATVMKMDGELVLYENSYPPEENPAGNITRLVHLRDHIFRMADEKGYGELCIFEMNDRGEVIRLKKGENYLYPVE